MQKHNKKKRLSDCYKFQGFQVKETVKGVFSDHNAKVITLIRQQKKQFVVNVERFITYGMTKKSAGYAIYLVGTAEYILSLESVVSIANAVAK